MIEWVWPLAFLLLPVPLLVRMLWRPLERQQAALTVPSVELFKISSDTAAGTGRDKLPWRIMLLWLIWILLVSAAARPQWTGEAVTLPTTGRDLMLAVDISGSRSPS